MTRIIPKVKSLQQVKELRKKSRITSMQLVQFQTATLNRLAENIILRTIHERMRAFGYSEKIILGTTVLGVSVISNDRFRIFFRSEYFADNGFDVALAREEGTSKHFIKPVNKKALNFEGDKFSKGHFVSGIIASHIVERTLNDMAQSFLDEYNRQKRDWLKQNFGEVAEITEG